jgi:putative tryptophan/tyrosine transport system substrate-binding protein
MKRRHFLGVLAAGAFSLRDRVGLAQQQSKVRRVGIIYNGPLWDYFRERLRDLGDIDGQNITIESRSATGDSDRLLAAAQELARLPVDVIAVAGSPAAKAAQAATDTVPIVAMVIGDPVAIGLVKDWQRPDGNITGSTTLSPNMALKRLQLLKNILPYLSRVAYFWNPENPSSRAYLEHLRIAAAPLGITVVTVEAAARSEFDEAFEKIAKSRANAMLIAGDIVQQRNIDKIIDFQRRHHLPGMFTRREDVNVGGLMSYGVSVPELYRNGAGYVHRILHGARPAELPFTQPAKLELVINLAAAKTIGLTIPPSILGVADEIISDEEE